MDMLGELQNIRKSVFDALIQKIIHPQFGMMKGKDNIFFYSVSSIMKTDVFYLNNIKIQNIYNVIAKMMQ